MLLRVACRLANRRDDRIAPDLPLVRDAGVFIMGTAFRHMRYLLSPDLTVRERHQATNNKVFSFVNLAMCHSTPLTTQRSTPLQSGWCESESEMKKFWITMASFDLDCSVFQRQQSHVRGNDSHLAC